MTGKLEVLFRYLDRLQGQAPLDELTALVARLDLTCDDVAGYVRVSDQGYCRNPLRAGPWYQAWVLCWKNGQRSPIHDHRGSSCAVRVLRGTMTQTFFAFAPNGHIKATG